ncbi:hypothetical protein K432DRAFT_133179 [Lepidopterella palustris CBS 459.81]|uniref:Uncharacterized protein n=1 Tax=Lepidopterella palustris CBS 459.81 TaxID=1314670 RepID=A0A8E2JBY0_9PEZI|nr:hypothetical protein K432DRAFT_133179 [Lepidopterella palustris CBS 459.81]
MLKRMLAKPSCSVLVSTKFVLIFYVFVQLSIKVHVSRHRLLISPPLLDFVVSMP